MKKAFLSLFACLIVSNTVSAQDTITFEELDRGLKINFGESPIAEYSFGDETVPRPHFRNLYAPGAIRVSRNHPPVEGQDKTDHADMHPGLWMSFGDISGSDFWRNKAVTTFVEYIDRGDPNPTHTGFIVKYQYLAENGETVCDEFRRYDFFIREKSYLIITNSMFTSENGFYFGDQEEMGLGIRVHTPMAVEKGGEILNGDGLKNGKQVWGKTADWCDYSGMVDGSRVGVTIFPSPDNFRPSWFHARDYGLLVANPFGRNAFTKEEKSRVDVQAGEPFYLRFGVLLYNLGEEDSVHLTNLQNEYKYFTDWIEKNAF